MLVDLFDADYLAGEDLAEIDFLAVEADAAAGGDDEGLVVEGAIELGQALIGPRRGAIELGRATHVEGLVRAVDEVIETGLLLKEVAAGRLGGLELQGQMHALVASVLLGMTGLDALDVNAESEPPDRQLDCGLSERTFNGRFIAATGRTPAQFIQGARLELARTLLLTALPLKTVAARSGLGSAVARSALPSFVRCNAI